MVTIKDNEIEDEYSLSPLQQGMLFHTLREKGVGMYISQAVSRFENLDCEALRQAWQLVVDRHAILRTSFHWEDPENPRQMVHCHVTVPFQYEDWRGLSPSEQNSQLRKFQREDRERGFDLIQPAQLRVTAIQVTKSRWFCVNSHHHIILDGWSGGLLAGEVGRSYEIFKRGRTPEFETPIPFGNYIRWIEGQDLAAAKVFWQNHLKAVTLPTPLPAERELGANARVRKHVESWEIKLDDEPAARVERFARNCRVTLNTVIQAVWPILLSRYSGRKSVIFGSLVSGRPPELPGVEAIVGMFLNTVPFCVTVEDDMSVGDWLRKIHGQRTELQHYEHSSLMLVQQLSQIPGGLPLFNSIVARKDVTQVASAGRKEARGAREGKSDQATFQQNYPILLNITASNGIALKITYDARKFRAIDISRIMEQLRHLLVSLCADPDRKLGDVGLASADEERRLRFEWNDTQQQVESPLSLVELLAQGVRLQPDRIAVRKGGQSLTFLELDRQVTRIAGYLHGLALGCDDVIAVAQQSPLEQVTAVLAVLRIGACCAPWDLSEQGEGLAGSFVDNLSRSQLFPGVCRALISDFKIDDPGEGAPIIISLARILETEILAGDVASELFDRRNDTGKIALILRQSTGEACEVSNWFLATRFVGQPVAFTPGSELALWSPADSIAFFSELYACWQVLGTANLIASPGSGNYTGFCQSLGASSVSRISVTPRILARILQNPEWMKEVAHIPVWTCSGEPLWPELGDSFAEQLPHSRLVNVFTTNRFGACLAWEVPKGGCIAEGVRLGLPLSNVRAYLSADSVHLAPVGVIGELLLAVDKAGQPHEAGEDAPKRQENPEDFLASECIYPTGVLARRWNDGSIEYLGEDHSLVDAKSDRYDAIALAAGMRAERELVKMMFVDEACVLLRSPSIRTGFIGSKHPNLDLADLHKRLCRVVYKGFAPTHYVVLAELPLDRYGRTDRAQLRAMAEPGVDASEFTDMVQNPKSELESIIAEVWMEVLKLDKISTDDNFFELGGHSLAATKATARLTKILKSDIHLKGIFEAPTISSFADWLQSDRHQEELPVSIEIADRSKDAPLTFTQQQLWVLGTLFPQLPTYTIPSNAVLTGTMDVDALEKAFLDVVERHEILRTVFVSNNGEPRQVIKSALDDFHLQQIDVTYLPEEDRMEKARWHGAQLGKIPWDFEHGPLIRPQLVKLGDDHYLLNTAFHHIISDGPSMGVFLGDLGTFFESRLYDRAPKLPEMPLQFADFAVWERDNVKGELFKRQLDYWRKNLDGATLLEIPTDFPRPAVHGFFGKKVKFEIDPVTGSRLRRLGQIEGATMFMTLLAVYQLVLHKYSRLDDIVVGSAMTNRIRVELEKLIGLFVNTLPLRTDFSGDPSFREILHRVRTCCLGAYANMDLPFEETIAQIQPQRDLSRQGSPLFQFMLIHNPGGKQHKEPVEGSSSRRIRPGDPHNDTGHANFDLLLSTRDMDDGLCKITIAYDTELFRAETIDRMIKHMQIIVRVVTELPDIPISQLDISGDEERRELLIDWNGREVEPETRLVHEIIADNARQFPDHPAVKSRIGVMTYAELDRRSNQLAAVLVGAGVRPESMVAISLPKGNDLIVGILAILKAGGAFVPVDPDYPMDRIKHILNDADCLTLISNPALGPVIQQEKSDLQFVDVTAQEINLQTTAPPDVDVALENLAYVIFTSGSTGLPKGVMIEHRNLTNIIRSQIKIFEINRDSTVLQMLSISFDAAVGEIFRTLIAGGTLYMADKDDLLPGPELVRLLKENRITVMAISPTALGAMPDCSAELTDLQTITVGGEACPQSVAERWGRGRRMLNGYGPTETTIGATLAVNWDFKDKPPLGHPLDGVKVYVLDKYMNLAPVGTPGELYIGGIGVSRGYLKRPDLTETSFIPNPFSTNPGERIYRAGDMVRWRSTGVLDYLGRVDQQVKIRGFRIELGEIETVLAKHPVIDHCTISVYEANSVKRLIAYYVIKEGTEVDTAELRAFIKQKLPDYMIPAFFMPLARIPTNNSGKVDRHALPKPDLDDMVSGAKEFIPPANELEETIAQLWREVLGLAQIGVSDNFFSIGGDSISAIRVAARANEVGVPFTAMDIFGNQTIREMAEFLKEQA